MIEVIVNGKEEIIKNDCSISELINILSYENKAYAVALNATFVTLDKYSNTKLNKGDEIEILAPMCGG